MSGYNGYSMSNNAVTAYEDGSRPASKIKGIPAALVKEYCETSEWHHTSKHFNCTNFYDPASARIVFGLDPEDGSIPCDHDDVKTWADLGNKRAMSALEKHKADAKKAEVIVHKDCFVTWLEWSGPRNRPICTEETVKGVKVEVKGKTATVFIGNGILIKRLDTNGFSFTPDYTKHCKAVAKHNREYERELVASGVKLPASLQKTVSFAGKAWAALSEDGKRVYGVYDMNHERSKSRTCFFEDYRSECKTALAKLGVVVSGRIVKVGKFCYFIP